MVFVPRKEHRL